MAKFKEYKPGTDYNVSINLGDYLSADHLCKQIEQIITDLDTSAIEATYSNLGQGGLHPKLMLGIIFYGYAVGIRSGRKLAQACQEQIPFIYLSRNYGPQKSSINDFRKNHYTHFSDLFTQVLQKCAAQGIIDRSLHIVDGSKIEANSARRRTKTEAQHEKWRQLLLEDLASLQEELSSQEESDPASKAQSELLKKKIAAKEHLCGQVCEAIEILAKRQDLKYYNITDPDGLLMKGKKKNTDTNYNVQVACCKNQLITYNNVVPQGNDKAQLIPALKGIASNTNQPLGVILADADYGTFESIEYMHQQQINGYVPYQGMNATFEDQPFHSSHFQYDPQRDVYVCPAKQQLQYSGSIKKENKYKLQYKKYRTKACQDCPYKKECVPKKSKHRIITREIRQGLRDEMRDKLTHQEGKEIYAQRLHPIEAIFGHLKYNLGYKQFLLRGLEKVKAEFNLMCIAYNLTKLAKHLLYSLFWGKSTSF